MELLQKVITTQWFHLLKVLIKEGRYQWITSDENGIPSIVSTLYLDGDLHCSIFDADDNLHESLSMNTALAHLAKMTTDLAALEKFASQIALYFSSLSISVFWIFNYEDYIEALIITAALPAVVYFLRKKIMGWIISFLFLFLKGRLSFLKNFKI